MPQNRVTDGAKAKIKELLIQNGRSYDSTKCRAFFEAENTLAVENGLEEPWVIYHAKTYQVDIMKFNQAGIFTKGSTFDYHNLFKFSESIGPAPLQVLPEDSHYAREVMNFYLNNYRHHCSIGFVQEYVKISKYDPTWEDVQRKSLYAELFWVHRILKVIEGIDAGSVEYEELALNMGMRKVSAGKQILNFGVVDEAGNLRAPILEETPNEKFELFQSIVAERNLKPWSVTMRGSKAKEYAGFMPQFHKVLEGHIERLK